MNTKRILIAGCGDVGSRAGVLLAQQGHTVYGLRRTINQLPNSIQGIAADLNNIDTLTALPDVDIVIYAAAATQRGVEGYRKAYIEGVTNVISSLPSPPQHLFFTSSTSVYGQNGGELVDESSLCEPRTETGKVMHDAELNVLNQPNATVVRFSGIYGPGRERMINMVREGHSAQPEPVVYSNRIHSDDCAGVLAFLTRKVIEGESLDDIYLASDLSPTPINEVTEWLAEQLNCHVTPSDRISRTSSKRCSSLRLQQAGYQFQYPTYQEGYAALLKD